MAQKLRVTATVGLRVREAPGLAGRIVGVLPFGAEVQPIGLADGWAILPADAGGARIRQAGAPAADAVLYASTDWLEPVGVVAPPPVAIADPRYLLGLNIQGGRLDLAHRAAQLGCRCFLVMDDFLGAHQLAEAWPGAIVMARRWWQYRADAGQILAGLEGAGSSRLYYIGHNEGDQVGQSGADLAWRLRTDVDVAGRITAGSGAKYCGGTFSMGAPDYTSAEVCGIINAELAPAYNAGQLLLDMHLYAPTPEHIYQDAELIWYERRYELALQRTALDPRRRQIVATEAGLDQGGVGGFSAHGLDAAAFVRWCRRWLQISARPVVVNGISYPSPLLAAALFQMGDRRTSGGGWAGYNLEGYFDQLADLWAGR